MLKLVIGTKNYSSWSLRAWLLLAHHRLDFEEILEPLSGPDLSKRLAVHSPSARVPVLIDGKQHIWDSLAICEYTSEQHLNGNGWPVDPAARAFGRSITAEMHSGFTDLRNHLPMNCRARRKISIDQKTQRDIDRIQAIWQECYERFGGPYLLGDFSIADSFFAPVAMRFITYQVSLEPASKRFIEQLLENHAMKDWLNSSFNDTEIVPEDEAGEPVE